VSGEQFAGVGGVDRELVEPEHSHGSFLLQVGV
jgi:hypothetical protein